jgi:hypothetical protein
MLPQLPFLWSNGVFHCSVSLRVIIVFRDITYVIIILYSWHLVICERFWLYVWNNWSCVMHMMSTWFSHKNQVWQVSSIQILKGEGDAFSQRKNSEWVPKHLSKVSNTSQSHDVINTKPQPQCMRVMLSETFINLMAGSAHWDWTLPVRATVGNTGRRPLKVASRKFHLPR